jgi:hypothetical protein
MRRDGSHERRITSEPGGVSDPDWQRVPGS